ncbi:Histidine kinase [Niastella yeongjuensis]|nr:Histidine kinase [Niastella yeongjuensis]
MATAWKYFRFEGLFFITYYLLFPIFTAAEYRYFEQHNLGKFYNDALEMLVFSPINLFSGLVFYAIVRRSLVSKKLVRFILYTILFLIGLVFYKKLTYLLWSHLEFLPAKARSDAARWANARGLHYSIIYMCRDFLCISALAYFIYSAKQEDQLRQLKEQQLLTELTYLKAQLHPHFFFNTLNNIYSLALKQSADTASLVARLAEMMRYILYEAEQPTVPLQKELRFLTNYIDTEKIRQHANNQISFDVQGIQPDTKIAPLLLLPFIENAFKHGLQQETGHGFVHIVLCESEKELLLQINNSKPSLPKENPAGIGLQNATKRLNLLYAGRYTLNIQSTAQTYQLNLSLQLHD